MGEPQAKADEIINSPEQASTLQVRPVYTSQLKKVLGVVESSLAGKPQVLNVALEIPAILTRRRFPFSHTLRLVTGSGSQPVAWGGGCLSAYGRADVWAWLVPGE